MARINLEALSYYLSYKHVPTPLSVIEGNSRKPALDVSSIKFYPLVEDGEEEIVNNMDTMLRAGIKRTLEEYPNVGFLTSGGIDSGVVTAIGAELSEKPINTFCLIYKNDLDIRGKQLDRTYAKNISDIYKTNHREVSLDINEYRDRLPDIIRCFGEPYSGYMTVYFVSRLVRKYTNVALTGDWADELFGSYKTHRLAHQYPDNNTWDLRYSGVVFNDEDKGKFCNGWSKYDTLEHLKKYSINSTATDSLNLMLESEIRSVFVDQTYLSIDVLSKVNSFKIIGGYSFPDLVDYIVRLPEHYKMRNGETKYILRKLALKYLPEEIVYRDKEGFITPTINLVMGLEGYIREILSPSRLGKHNLFDIDYVRELLDTFYSNQNEMLSYKIWNLLCFQIWWDIYIDK